MPRATLDPNRCYPARRSWRRPARVMRWAAALPILFACGSENQMPSPVADSKALFWDVDIDHHAVTLSTAAPFDTLRIAATPRNHQAQPLSGLPAPTYTSSDIEKVLVTPEGLLVAVAPTTDKPVRIVATITAGNLTHADSTWVKVVDDPTPPVLASLSIHPIPPDSAKAPALAHNDLVGTFVFGLQVKSLPVRAVDASGTPMTGLIVSFRSSDTTTATIKDVFDSNCPSCELDPDYGGVYVGHRPGNVSFYATATAFGVTKADTVAFRIGWPISAMVDVQPASAGSPVNVFAQPEVRIGVGGVVWWSTYGTETPTEVTFTDPTNVIAFEAAAHLIPPEGFPLPVLCAYFGMDCSATGNFVLGPSATGPNGQTTTAARVFTASGTYNYQDPVHGTHGRIVVVDER